MYSTQEAFKPYQNREKTENRGRLIVVTCEVCLMSKKRLAKANATRCYFKLRINKKRRRNRWEIASWWLLWYNNKPI